MKKPITTHILNQTKKNSLMKQIFTTYHILIMLLLSGHLFASVPNNNTIALVAPGASHSDIVAIHASPLEPPYFGFDPTTQCASFITLSFSNDNEGSATEIYRSLTESGGYSLIATVAPGIGTYEDDVKPHTNYYYKLRAIKDDIASDFSEVQSFYTADDFYAPGLTATVTANAVTLKLVDRSYADDVYEFTRYDESTGESLLHSVSLRDSGQVYTFVDESVLPNTTYRYEVKFYQTCEGIDLGTVASVTITTAGNALEAPYFGFDPTTQCASFITLPFSNDNEGSATEIYRSLTESGGYSLIATVAPGIGTYEDDVKPHTNYYYKLRAIKDDIASDFSQVQSFYTADDFYAPELTATVTSSAVTLNLLDRSYADEMYEFYRYDASTEETILLHLVSLPDSGQVYTFVDESAVPNTTYRYEVGVYQTCEGIDLGTVASVTITTPNGPGVQGFTLVNYKTDKDIMELTLGEMGNDLTEFDRPNIRANTTNSTKSVVFYLNGKLIATENIRPFALFGDNNGNYTAGRLKPGYYSLTAVAYSRTGGKGIKGNSLDVSIFIDESASRSAVVTERHREIKNDASIFPNPIANNSVVQISGEANSNVRVEVLDYFGKPITTLYQGVLNEDGTMKLDLADNNFKTGNYILLVKFGNEKLTRRFVVK